MFPPRRDRVKAEFGRRGQVDGSTTEAMEAHSTAPRVL